MKQSTGHAGVPRWLRISILFALHVHIDTHHLQICFIEVTLRFQSSFRHVRLVVRRSRHFGNQLFEHSSFCLLEESVLDLGQFDQRTWECTYKAYRKVLRCMAYCRRSTRGAMRMGV